MKQLQVIGTQNPDIDYIDRPTVKVIVQNDDGEILIINDGLLPGGGIDGDESNLAALKRELLEELGIEVTNQHEIGCVIQYRDLIGKRYVIYGYNAVYKDKVANPTPQDDREAQFTHNWYSLEDARLLLQSSIASAEADIEMSRNSDAEGRLSNRMTTKVLLDGLVEDS